MAVSALELATGHWCQDDRFAVNVPVPEAIANFANLVTLMSSLIIFSPIVAWAPR